MCYVILMKKFFYSVDEESFSRIAVFRDCPTVGWDRAGLRMNGNRLLSLLNRQRRSRYRAYEAFAACNEAVQVRKRVESR